jgi:PAS domain S-box-containing protein
MEELSTTIKMSTEEMQNHTQLLINAFDRDHRILFWNKKCETLFGIPAEKAVGKKLEELLPETKGNEKMVRLKRVFAGREMLILRDKYDHLNMYYEQRLIPVRDSKGNVVAAINVVKELAAGER